MSKSLKEILSTPIKDTTVSEIRLQVVVGLPLPLIIIYFISLFSPYFISFSFGFLVLGVYMFFIKNIENHFDLYSEEEGKKYSFEGLCVESLLIGLIAFTSFLPFYYHFNKSFGLGVSFGFLIPGILIFIRRKIFTESSRIIEDDDNLELGYHPLAYYILGIVCGFRLLSSSALLFIKYFTKGYQVYPSFSGFLVNLGLIYFDLKDYEKAIVYFDKAIDGGDNNDWLYLKRFEAFYNLGRYYSARMSLNEDILKNPTPKWVIHGKVAMMMRFKGYPFYLIHDGHVKVSRPFNVGGYRAHYKFKELAYNERMVYFRKFIKWNRGCE